VLIHSQELGWHEPNAAPPLRVVRAPKLNPLGVVAVLEELQRDLRRVKLLVNVEKFARRRGWR
jgi:hypothetical protein